MPAHAIPEPNLRLGVARPKRLGKLLEFWGGEIGNRPIDEVRIGPFHDIIAVDRAPRHGGALRRGKRGDADGGQQEPSEQFYTDSSRSTIASYPDQPPSQGDTAPKRRVKGRCHARCATIPRSCLETGVVP